MTMIKILPTICLSLSALLFGGCSGLWNADPTDPVALGVAKQQLITWIPRTDAGTPTEVRAMVHVALGKAKQLTEQNLCGDQWVFSGQTLETNPPSPGTAPTALGAYAAWEYRLSWDPDLRDCSQATSEAYFRMLSEHLPGWMIVRTGPNNHFYRLGQAVFAAPDNSGKRQVAGIHSPTGA